MDLLIKQAVIVNFSSPFNGQKKDILINNGIIVTIADQITENTDQTIQHEGLHVSIGWMDSFAHFCDPGLEYRETLETGINAAAAGGFTDVMMIANTNPVVHNKSQVEYIVQKSKQSAVNVHPIGAITKNAAGKELAEMYDMSNSGAIAFSDGLHAIQDGGLLIKALQYVKAIDATIIQIPEDISISNGGLMNEGIISTRLGLPGNPAMAEELMVARDIKIAAYTESKLHFTGISSAKSVEQIRLAKKAGVKVSCAVTPYHLYFCDEDLVHYDTNLKVNPPLRTSTDRLALWEGLTDGTIDLVASHHTPHIYDSKVCEFEYAKDGMIGLESLFGVLGIVNNISTATNGFTLAQLINCITIAPRQIFSLQIPQILEGSEAKLTLFNPYEEYIFDTNNIRSKSKNTPFIGKKLRGKVIGIINGQKSHFN